LGSLLLGGCHVGTLSPAAAGGNTVASQTAPLKFRYAPPEAVYHYVLTEETNPGGSNSHTTVLQFAVKVSKKSVGFAADTTVEGSLTDGKPTTGITESMIKEFKLTSELDDRGGVVASHGVGLEPFHAAGARDLGNVFRLPPTELKAGDTWSEKRGSGANAYELKFKFVGIEQVGSQRIAKFEERAADKRGGKVEQPTLISVDADTGVLTDKAAQTLLPTDPPIPVRSEIRLR